MRLKDRVAVVVGGGRGIGKEICLSLGKEGAKIVVVDPGGARDGSPDSSSPAGEVVAELKAMGVTAVERNESATEYETAKRIVDETVKSFGRLDILINSAGVLREKMIWNMPEEDWDTVLKIHLKSVFNMSSHAARVMRTQRNGRIVSMCSEAWKGTIGQANYGAAKGAIWSFSRALARELGRYGITSNVISPSASTRLTVTEEVKAGFRKRLEAGLITRERYEQVTNMPGPEYIAPLAVWLCTDAAADVNGQNFRALAGKIATYQEPTERACLFKTEDKGMFTLDDLDAHFMTTLMAGVTNPAPAQADEKKA